MPAPAVARTLVVVPTPLRVRREPPPFRRVRVARTEALTPHLVRVTLTGPELEGFDQGLPAASVRLLLPHHDEVTVPTWSGNEFLHADGSRPALRTLTPRRFSAEGHELDVEIVLHGDGPMSAWAGSVHPGDAAAVSGTGRGYTIEPTTSRYVLAGDESALPAISVLLEALPPDASITVLAEVARPDARLDLPPHPGATVQWFDLRSGGAPGDALVAAVHEAEVASDGRVWVAGEAAAVQGIRKHLFDERGLERSRCTVRGYWKRGRAGQADD